jgi:hypothetical protein
MDYELGLVAGDFNAEFQEISCAINVIDLIKYKALRGG